MSEILTFLAANPEVLALVVPVALQLASWAVKKSPWGWDNSLLDWLLKHRGLIARLLKRR